MERNRQMGDIEKVKSTQLGDGFVVCLPSDACFMSSESPSLVDVQNLGQFLDLSGSPTCRLFSVVVSASRMCHRNGTGVRGENF